MKLERRRANLEKKIQGMEEDIDRQEKARKGIESLSKVYQEQPDFTDQKGAEDVSRQLLEVRGREGRGGRGGREGRGGQW